MAGRVTTFKEQLNTEIPVFFNADEFAVEAIVNASPVLGHFDPGSENDRWTKSPSFTCADVDIAAAPYGAPVSVEGADYWIEAYQPDGYGLATLILRPA